VQADTHPPRIDPRFSSRLLH